MKLLTFLLMLVLGTFALYLLGHSQGPLAPPSAVVEPKPVGPATTDVVFERDRERPEAAEGLPVPIYPGTRVTQAQIQPPSSPATTTISVAQEARPSSERTIAGRLSATDDRARADARLQLEREVADWITPEVPPAASFVNPKTGSPELAATKLPYRWRVPTRLIDRMIRETRVRPVVRDYGTVYEAMVVADFSAENRAAILAAYQEDLVRHRLTLLGGRIAFLLTCLAALAGYIRADEATRGYYTHWLRGVAAAGVGASGVLIYQMLM